MKLFGNLLARDKVHVEAPPCPHTAIAPRWDNAADMGKHDKISCYVCTACGEVLPANVA
jgi:hypothetical protein